MSLQRKSIRLMASAVLWIALSACASQGVTLVDPVSAATAECSASGTGLGTGWADVFMNNCLSRYKQMGYVPLDQLTPEPRADLKKRGALPAN
jgi:hypothetical protein